MGLGMLKSGWIERRTVLFSAEKRRATSYINTLSLVVYGVAGLTVAREEGYARSNAAQVGAWSNNAASVHDKKKLVHDKKKLKKIAVKNTAYQSAHSEDIDVKSRRAAFNFTREQHEANSDTHISAERLKQQGVVSIFNLQNLAPNLSIQQSNGTSTVDFNIRGIGMRDITNNNTQSVMTYIDGVAYPFSSMMTGQLFDVSAVSIKPGPVGFEHGQADTGGEVNIVTNDPTDKLHGGLSEDIASYARSRTDAYISGPITENLGFRIAAQTLQGGGWQYSPSHNTNLGDADTGAVRGKLKWNPDSKTEIKLTAQWVQDRSENINGVTTVNSLPSRPGNLVSLNGSSPAGSYVLPYRQTEWSMDPAFANLIGRNANLKPSERNVLWGFNLRFVRDLNFAKLETISAYETEHRGEFIDEDATIWRTGDEYRTISTNSFSQEIKLYGNSLHDRLKWIVGAYYNRVQSKQNEFLDFTDYTPARGYLSQTKFNDDQQTFSQYAHLSYQLPRHVTLFGGISHEADDRQLYNLHTIHYASSNLCSATKLCQAQTQDLGFAASGAASNQFSGEIGVQWQPIQNFMYYFKVSKGFKPGALTANNTVVQEQLVPTKPETVMAYETGFKSDIIKNKVRLNAAAFYYDYRGQELASPIVLPQYGTIGKYINIPHSEIWGIEATLELHPFKNLFISQNIGYQRGNYIRFEATDLPAVNAHYKNTGQWAQINTNYANEDMGNPKLTLNGFANYRVNVFRYYQWETGLDWQYRSTQATSVGGLNTYGYHLPPYFTLGAHMSFRPNSGKWNVTVYGSNLANRKYYTAGGSVTVSQYWLPAPPRFIGARVGFDL
ncbi:TonB-dependent receptor [Acetobacter syzygii]|uniref:TonB-dependent receptor n=1 Tax=Acetobacter syzygii TaxID=146476 RepID=UPI0039EB13D0